MEMIKLKFSLKQITPMIHFQNDDGATIRATELKPKLDRFILSWLAYEKEVKKHPEQKLGSETEDNLESKDWLIDKDHSALNYKMRIKAMNKDKNMDLLDHSSKKKKFLGNADYILKNENNENKYTSTFYEEILVKIVCFDELLANKVIQLLPILVDITAFGLQQSKGYGNFKVDKIFKDNKLQTYKPNAEKSYIKLLEHFNVVNNNILIYKLKKDFKGYEKLLNEIAKLNSSIKKGMITGEYKPDFLKNKAVINEKEAMKIFLRDKGYKIKKVLKFQTLDNSKVYYTRGLLGFAQEYDFSTTRYNNHKPCEVNFKVIATDNEKKLIRFPSPLHYHVDNDYRGIYIIINNKSLQKLQELNPQIEFRGDDNGNFIGKISAQLSNEFKLEEFFDSIVLKKNKNIKKLGDNQNGRK